jgi:hypothetical protein
MRKININYEYNGKPTITKNEYIILKESIRNSFEPSKISVLNKSLNKQQCFDILFNDNITINSHLSYIHFFNIVREFVIQKKTFRNWKLLDNYKPIKEIKEIRKDKIEKIENG